jgi:hypothetical protein
VTRANPELAPPAPPATGPDQAPLLAFPRGHPTAEEIAAVVAVLALLPGPAEQPRTGHLMRSEWSARYRMMREPLRRGPGAWRASALPR